MMGEIQKFLVLIGYRLGFDSVLKKADILIERMFARWKL